MATWQSLSPTDNTSPAWGKKKKPWQNALRPQIPSLGQVAGPAMAYRARQQIYQPQPYAPPRLPPPLTEGAAHAAWSADWDAKHRLIGGGNELSEPEKARIADRQRLTAYANDPNNPVQGRQNVGWQLAGQLSPAQEQAQGVADVAALEPALARQAYRRGLGQIPMTPDQQWQSGMEQGNLNAAHAAWLAQNPQVGPGAPIDPTRAAWAQDRADARSNFREAQAGGGFGVGITPEGPMLAPSDWGAPSTTDILQRGLAAGTTPAWITNKGALQDHLRWGAPNLNPDDRAREEATRRAMVTGQASGAPLTRAQAEFQTAGPNASWQQTVSAYGPQAAGAYGTSPEGLQAMVAAASSKMAMAGWTRIEQAMIHAGKTPEEIAAAKAAYEGGGGEPAKVPMDMYREQLPAADRVGFDAVVASGKWAKIEPYLRRVSPPIPEWKITELSYSYGQRPPASGQYTRPTTYKEPGIPTVAPGY